MTITGVRRVDAPEGKRGRIMVRRTMADEVNELIERFGTRDPFELAEAAGAEVVFSDLGELKGMYTYIQNNRFIVINNQLDDDTARIVCAHELGHDQLHRDFVKDSFLRETVLFDVQNRTEYEANLFAAELLISDGEMLRYAEEETDVASIAAMTCTDVNLVALKLSGMARRGHALNQFDYRADFLKY